MGNHVHSSILLGSHQPLHNDVIPDLLSIKRLFQSVLRPGRVQYKRLRLRNQHKQRLRYVTDWNKLLSVHRRLRRYLHSRRFATRHFELRKLQMLNQEARSHQVQSPPKPVGMGDVVAAATTAVGVKPCGGCSKRKAAMNKATPGWLSRILLQTSRVVDRLRACVRMR